jgi:hypothetical protein
VPAPLELSFAYLTLLTCPMPDGILPHPTDSSPSLMVDAAVALLLCHLLKWGGLLVAIQWGRAGAAPTTPPGCVQGEGRQETGPRLHPVQHGHWETDAVSAPPSTTYPLIELLQPYV